MALSLFSLPVFCVFFYFNLLGLFFNYCLNFSCVFIVSQRRSNNTLKMRFILTQKTPIFSTIFGHHSFSYFSVFTIWWSRWWKNLFSLHFLGYLAFFLARASKKTTKGLSCIQFLLCMLIVMSPYPLIWCIQVSIFLCSSSLLVRSGDFIFIWFEDYFLHSLKYILTWPWQYHSGYVMLHKFLYFCQFCLRLLILWWVMLWNILAIK